MSGWNKFFHVLIAAIIFAWVGYSCVHNKTLGIISYDTTGFWVHQMYHSTYFYVMISIETLIGAFFILDLFMSETVEMRKKRINKAYRQARQAAVKRLN